MRSGARGAVVGGGAGGIWLEGGVVVGGAVRGRRGFGRGAARGDAGGASGCGGTGRAGFQVLGAGEGGDRWASGGRVLRCSTRGCGSGLRAWCRRRRRDSLEWNSIATATLLPFHRCRCEAGADRALADAWSSSDSGASGVAVCAVAIAGARGSSNGGAIARPRCRDDRDAASPRATSRSPAKHQQAREVLGLRRPVGGQSHIRGPHAAPVRRGFEIGRSATVAACPAIPRLTLDLSVSRKSSLRSRWRRTSAWHYRSGMGCIAR
jgi:hypothetical protein